jgi:hypothetical protein
MEILSLCVTQGEMGSGSLSSFFRPCENIKIAVRAQSALVELVPVKMLDALRTYNSNTARTAPATSAP